MATSPEVGERNIVCIESVVIGVKTCRGRGGHSVCDVTINIIVVLARDGDYLKFVPIALRKGY